MFPASPGLLLSVAFSGLAILAVVHLARLWRRRGQRPSWLQILAHALMFLWMAAAGARAWVRESGGSPQLSRLVLVLAVASAVTGLAALYEEKRARDRGERPGEQDWSVFDL